MHSAPNAQPASRKDDGSAGGSTTKTIGDGTGTTDADWSVSITDPKYSIGTWELEKTSAWLEFPVVIRAKFQIAASICGLPLKLMPVGASPLMLPVEKVPMLVVAVSESRLIPS